MDPKKTKENQKNRTNKTDGLNKNSLNGVDNLDKKMNRIKINSKKAFLRTLEATLAVVITLVYVVMITQRGDVQSSAPATEKNLKFLSQDESFRQCVISENKTCVNTKIKSHIDNKLNFTFIISKNPENISNELNALPDKDIVSESYFFSGNITKYSGKTLRIYYWNR